MIRLTRRNKGVMEPEFRLWMFLLPMVLIPSCLILWGVGAAHQIHWFGLIVAMGGLAFCSTSGITLGCNYMIDSYRHMSADGIVTVILIRNTMSFAMSYG
jgi:hypothetical protein